MSASGFVRTISFQKVLNMADRWYYASDNQKFGPYSAIELQQLAVLTKLLPSDMVWKNDIEKGVLAARVKHLFPNSQAKILLPTGAIAAALNELCSPALPPQASVAIILNEVAHPEGRPTSSNEPGASVVQLAEIPIVVLLQPLPGQIDMGPLPTPWTASPVIEAILNETIETSPVLVTPAVLIGPKIPAIQDAYKPTQNNPARKRRATAVRGLVIVFQDGVSVKYRKKCIKCGNDDSCTRSMPIRNGMVRESYYCPKCRKNQEVIIQGHII